MASITLRLLIALNASMMIAKKDGDLLLTTNRYVWQIAFSFSTPKMSMQKEVVRAVKAESALLNAAVMIPIVKKIRDRMSQYAGGAEHWEDIVVQCGK